MTLRETKSDRIKIRARSRVCGRETGRILELEGHSEIVESNTFILQIKQDLRKVNSFDLIVEDQRLETKV